MNVNKKKKDAYASPGLLADITIPTKYVMASSRWPEVHFLRTCMLRDSEVPAYRLLMRNTNYATWCPCTEIQLLEFESAINRN